MKEKWYRNFLTMLALLALGLLFFFPLYWMFMTSFKTTAQIFVEKPIFFTKEFYTGNYAEIFQQSYVAQFFIKQHHCCWLHHLYFTGSGNYGRIWI